MFTVRFTLIRHLNRANGHPLGFDLSEMGTNVYDDAVVDVVGPDTVVSQPVVVKVRQPVSIPSVVLQLSYPCYIV